MNSALYSPDELAEAVAWFNRTMDAVFIDPYESADPPAEEKEIPVEN